MILIILFVVFATVLAKWYTMKFSMYNWGVHKMNGPISVPLLGNAIEILRLDTTELLQYLTTNCTKYAGRAAIFVGFLPSVIVTEYKLVEKIMSSTTITKKSNVYRFMQPWLAAGLLLSDSEKWFKRRKMITPAFHFQILDKFLEIFDFASTILVNKMKEDNPGKPTDVYPFVTLCTLDTICETAMGTQINAQIGTNSAYVSAVKEMGRIIMLRTVSALHQNDFTYRFTAEYQIEKRSLKILHSHTDSVIKSRREELLANPDFINGNIVDGAPEGARKKCAFLDVLLQSTIDGKPLTDADIREEVDTFMFEGHDTTSSAISFAIYEIAQNPRVQEKLVDEQLMIVNRFDDKLTMTSLNEMKYLDLVIKETLRMYPSVPLFGREVSENFEFDGMTFRKGLNLGIFAYGIHRDPKNFPDPDEFKPERFSKENYSGNMPYAYIPFAAGPRNCIGQKFAMLEMKVVLSKVIRQLVLRPVPGFELQLVPETILKSANGIKVIVSARKFDKVLKC